MSKQKPNIFPQPSRLVLNAGILIGGIIGFLISQNNDNAIAAFIITGICCLIGAALFSYAEVFWHMRNNPPQ